MITNQPSHAIGMMSGSSLDALDIAFCSFVQKDKLWKWELLEKSSIPIPLKWQNILKEAPQFDLQKFYQMHILLGSWLGEQVAGFCNTNAIHPDIVVSHGHTLLHDPLNNYTVQLGHGAAVAAKCGFPVLCDVRSSDMIQGGQGAPLAHIADVHLLTGYEAYVNLGGIANITFVKNINLAYDVCFVNQILNRLANQLGHDYDKGGAIARSGQISQELIAELEKDPYYQLPAPKSLDNNYVIKMMSRQVWESELPVADKLASCTYFIAKKLIEELAFKLTFGGSVLISGGGAYNNYLIDLMKQLGSKQNINIEKAAGDLIEFKEAIFMAFMGILYLRDLPNCLSTFTGATKNTINGALYKP